MEKLPQLGKLVVSATYGLCSDRRDSPDAYYEPTDVSQATTMFEEVADSYRVLMQIRATEAILLEEVDRVAYLQNALIDQIDDIRALSRNNVMLYKLATHVM